MYKADRGHICNLMFKLVLVFQNMLKKIFGKDSWLMNIMKRVITYRLQSI